MVSFLPLDAINVTQKIVVVRADLNLPMQNGKITDSTRLTRFMPTLRLLVQRQARVVILSHLGRPQGKPDSAYSLHQILPALEAACGQPVAWSPDCLGEKTHQAISALQPGQILLLENVRFYPGEETNDPTLAKALAALGEVYVNDAFSCAHRAHASVVGITDYLPAMAGLSLQAEVMALTHVLETPQRPLMAIIGGAKVSTKLALIENLMKRVDILVLGGAMANTFLMVQGVDVGDSLVEPTFCETAQRILSGSCEILLPQDWVWEGRKIVDMGPQSQAIISKKLKIVKTVVWNGPMGIFERPPFDQGTRAIALALAEATKNGVSAVVGGGDTLAAIHAAGLQDQDFAYVSTAGGAFLEWLEGKTLPGIAALMKGKQGLSTSL